MLVNDRLIPVLALADDHLILGQRVAELTGSGPTLEEELASANLGLDLIGQARALYSWVAAREGAGRTEDDFAFHRSERHFRNLLLVEQPNEDFAHVTVRTFFFSAFMAPFWAEASRSADPDLGGIAGQAEKESVHHLRHAAEWVIRLGDGTEESRARVEDALETLWPFCGELFEQDGPAKVAVLSKWLPDRAALEPAWRATVGEVLAQATLPMPSERWFQTGGRKGQHTEYLGHLLAHMQSLPRAHPGASW